MLERERELGGRDRQRWQWTSLLKNLGKKIKTIAGKWSFLNFGWGEIIRFLNLGGKM